MNARREGVFWDLIGVLDNAGFLPHIMIIGSWAEYLYVDYFDDDYVPNLKTHDIDVFYQNPFFEIEGAENLRGLFKEAGFLFTGNPSGTTSFFKGDIEVEFLSSAWDGKGIFEIPFTGISAEKLDNLSLLEPMEIESNGHAIKVPTPASYIAHKLYINPIRRPAHKRQKDIDAVRTLLSYIQKDPREKDAVESFINRLPDETRSVILEVAFDNGLDMRKPAKQTTSFVSPSEETSALRKASDGQMIGTLMKRNDLMNRASIKRKTI